MKNPDIVIVGAGLSGLVTAILCAEAGRRVRVLEQHKIPGGYLQQFARKKTLFDVGFHYLGGTEHGGTMRRLLEHLQVWDRIRFISYPQDEAIEVRSGGRLFSFPTRFVAFRDKAIREWPAEREGIERFCSEVDGICSQFAWFHLRKNVSYRSPFELNLPTGSFTEVVSRWIKDPWLLEVLGFQSFNLGLNPEEVPWVKYALAFRSNFDETCRIAGGGAGLTDALVKRGRELGVDYSFDTAVTGFRCARRRVEAVETSKGETIEAATFFACAHPKPILQLIPDREISPLFKDRILSMRDSRGAVQVFLRIKGEEPPLGATGLLVRDEVELAKSPPINGVFITCPSAADPPTRGGHRIEAMTYMSDELFSQWRGLPTFKRGPEYEALKGGLRERMVSIIKRQIPGLEERITDVYASTPLTDWFYTWNESGGVFGISHDVSQQGLDRPQSRVRLKNLWFSGHSIAMPGICGVAINAFHTCAQALPDPGLFETVATYS